MIQMNVRSLALDHQMNPVVFLVDQAETLALPIWIGAAEAQSIALQLRGIRPPRPMTHDLLRNMLSQLAVSVGRVIVADVREGAYVAEIHVNNHGADVVVDSRASDAIALALRTEGPIYVKQRVAENAIPLRKAFDEHDLEDFKKFLERVRPADFQTGSENT